jgi:hypothetical protein
MSAVLRTAKFLVWGKYNYIGQDDNKITDRREERIRDNDKEEGKHWSTGLENIREEDGRIFGQEM